MFKTSSRLSEPILWTRTSTGKQQIFFLPFFSANEVEVFFVAEDYIKSWKAIAKGDWCGGFIQTIKMIVNVLRLSQFSVLQVSLSWNPVQVFFFLSGDCGGVLPQKWKYSKPRAK